MLTRFVTLLLFATVACGKGVVSGGTPTGDPTPGDATSQGDTTGDPGTGDPGTGDPGPGDPGTGDPGTGDPGTGDPGAGDPGPGDPGTGDPGPGDPGPGDPGPGDPGPGDVGPQPEVSIADVTLAEGDSSTTDFVFTVTLDIAPAGTLTVDWSTADDTATAPADYTAANGTLTFTNAGALSQTVTVQVNGDTDIESNETFTVSLTNVAGGTIATGSATATIQADDFPELSIAGVSQTEGSSGTSTFDFTVTLSAAAPVGLPAQVAWSTADGSATAPDDYVSDAGTLTFTNGGPLTQTISVVIAGDTDQEPDEDFTVTLTSPQNATIGTASATGTIVSDDFPSLTVDDVSVVESDGGTSLVFTAGISFEPLSGQDASFDFATADGTATAGSDYTTTTGSLTFINGGSLSQSITVPVLGDDEIELDETVLVDFSGAVSLELPDPSAIGTILADDFPVLSIDDPSVLEGHSGTSALVFTVTIAPEPLAGQDAQVTFSTQNGTATTADSDYATQTGSLTFTNGGNLSQTVTVDVTGDTSIEPDETVILELTAPLQVELPDPTGTGTILADDFPSVSIADAAADEGSTGPHLFPLTVTVSADPPAGYDLSVDWTTANGTATAGEDYTAGSSTLTFTSGGGLTQTIDITVSGDTDEEPDETFTVTLSNAQNGSIGTATATATLTNDDFPTLSIDDVSILEGTGGGTTTLTFTVTLDRAPTSADVLVDWATANGSATAGEDYSADSSSLTFTSAGPLTQSIDVTITRDTDVEPDETFTVVLSNVQNGAIGDGSGTGTILADDFPDVSVGDVSVDEGDSGTTTMAFPVTLSDPPPTGYTLSVTVTTSDGTAIAGVDYAALNGVTFNFAPGGSVDRTFNVSIYGDLLVEADETFTVTLSNPANAGNLLVATATGTIVSDDPPHARIHDVRVEEGDASTTDLVLTVTLNSPALTGGAEIDWMTIDGTAMAPVDYAAASGTLSFAEGETTQTITISVQGDAIPEWDEIFIVELSAISGVVVDESVGIGTILDDDIAHLTIDDVMLAEGDSGTTDFVFTVTTSQLPQAGNDITVDWATENRTAGTADYSPGSGSLTFTSAGPNTATVTIPVIGETTTESFEDFAVRLSGAVNAHIRDDVGVGTIIDDDGAIILVDPTATGTADGLTWPTAYRTVQAGIDRASALGGGQVWVAAAYYSATTTDSVAVIPTRVGLFGGFEGYAYGLGAQETALDQRDPLANETILDGNRIAYHVVQAASGAWLDGFTITRGFANGSTTATYRGGGIYPIGSPTIVGCRIFDNESTDDGGGMFNNYSPWIRNTRFVANISNDQGGGMYDDGSAKIEDSVFVSNSSTDYAGGLRTWGSGTYVRVNFYDNVSNYGGGAQFVWSRVTMRECNFVNNFATTSGGGLYSNWSDDLVTDSAFVHNRASSSAGGLYVRDSGYSSNNGSLPSHQRGGRFINIRVEHNQASSGGGIYAWNYFGNEPARFIRARIANNRASSGGGVYNNTTEFLYIDAIIEGNTASSRGGGFYNTGSAPVISSSTLVGNVAPQGPEIYNSGSSTAPSVPVANDTIVFGTSPFTPAEFNYASCTGCGVVYTACTLSDSAQDPLFVNVPLLTTRINGNPALDVITVSSASTYFAVGDTIEIADDGVARTVGAVDATTVTFSPALPTTLGSNYRVDNWGAAATDVSVDLHLDTGSPSIDAGSNAAVSADIMDLDGDGDFAEPLPIDYAGNPRFVDDPAADTGTGTPPIVDIGAYEGP